MALVAQCLAGLLFGLGLVAAEMTNPAKVQNFLDVAAIANGQWDGSLALVMAGAALVTFIGYRFILRWPKPVLAARFHLPPPAAIDASLIAGSAIFGFGWGLAGFCPGPALVALASGSAGALQFTIAMLVGMYAARAWKAFFASRTKTVKKKEIGLNGPGPAQPRSVP